MAEEAVGFEGSYPGPGSSQTGCEGSSRSVGVGIVAR